MISMGLAQARPNIKSMFSPSSLLSRVGFGDETKPKLGQHDFFLPVPIFYSIAILHL